jgi:hypothetical protein
MMPVLRAGERLVRYLLRSVTTVSRIILFLILVYMFQDFIGGRCVAIETCVSRFAASFLALSLSFITGSMHTEADNLRSG